MSSLLPAGLPACALEALEGKLTLGALFCGDCPAFAPCAPMGARFEGLGLCCFGGETLAVLVQEGAPACFALRAEVEGAARVRR